MAIRKRVFTVPILEKIISMIEELDFVKSVLKGDLSNLPSPEEFKEYMPVVYISAGRIKNEYADGNPKTKILNQTYNFNIIYVRYFDREKEASFEVIEDLILEGEQISEMLMERDDLDGLELQGGNVLCSLVTDIDFDSVEYKLFKDLEIPASVCKLNYQVYFRTTKMN